MIAPPITPWLELKQRFRFVGEPRETANSDPDGDAEVDVKQNKLSTVH